MAVSRRDALVRMGAAAAVLGGAAVAGRSLYDRGGIELSESKDKPQTRDFRLRDKPTDLPELVVAKNDADPAVLVQKAMAALGGMKRFISRGDIVVIKPNIGWDRTPIHAANTNPKVVAEVVRQAYDAGAKRVIVTDASCHEPSRCFQR
jgi:hypothetical protein